MAIDSLIPYNVLIERVSHIFQAYVVHDDADYIASCLVQADARGVASHGIGRIPVYTRRLREGLINRKPELKVNSGASAIAHINGDNGMGYVVARKAMDEAIARAQSHGIGMVFASNSNHFGMSAVYLQQALDAGLAALAFTNAPPLMPIWGGRTPFLGTSPFAFAAPGPVPILLDMATSVVAFGKIRRAARMGESIPEHWALDDEGNPTTDPLAAIKGVVLPMAGPKGSGLSLMMEVVAGVMSGAAFGGRVRNQNSDFDAPQDVGHAFLTFQPDLFLAPDDYTQRMEALVTRAKTSPLAQGFDSIRMPGEHEALLAIKARACGLDIAQADQDMLVHETQLAASFH